MKIIQPSRPVRLWAGTIAPLLGGWIAVAFSIYLSAVLGDATPRGWQNWVFGALGVFWLTAFPIIGWMMGLVCSSFWRSLAAPEKQRDWSIGLLCAFFLPTLILGCGGLWLSGFLFAVMWFPFRRGFESAPRWNHFLGLRNEWEREADSSKSDE